jgi:hypothetical protein
MAPDPNTRVPKYGPPPGACDAHCHIFGPGDRYPYAADRSYTPPDAPLERFIELQKTLGLSRAVLVNASCHGVDNTVILDAIAQSAGRYRGVANVDETFTDRDFQKLHDGGIRGIRFNFVQHLGGTPDMGEFERLVARAKTFGWHVVLHFEVNRGRVALLQAQANHKVSQLDLGRRVGVAGAIDAEPLPELTPGPLGVSVEQALTLALDQGPLYRIVRASERIADATLRAARSRYLPTAVVTANVTKFDENFFPNALQRSTLTFGVSLPIWDNGQRELAVARARASRDVARAVREDLERGALADVTEAWESYHTARASAELAEVGVEVAEENFRVQERRYQAGASTILELLEAQNQLTEAEVAVVQARFAARLSLAGLEVLLGRRLQQ